jgi:long-chain fatty acid transport protein
MTTLRTTCLAAALVAYAAPAAAQSSLQVPLQFDFLNPGARSLALGGAFTGLADDATAAFTNPAGLTILNRTELSVEGRYRAITTPFLERGRISGTVTQRLEDTVAGPVYGEQTAHVGGASFVSFVYPRGKWALAAYRHELVKIRDRFQSNGVFQDATIAGSLIQLREFPQVASRDVDITNYGVSVGYRVNDTLALGGGLIVSDFQLEGEFVRYDTTDEPRVFGPPDFSKELYRVRHSGNDVALAFTSGVQVTPTPKIKLGAVYRQGPKFDVQSVEPASNTRLQGIFRVPREFSAGLAIRPSDALVMALDYSFVQYSRLLNDYVPMQTAERPANFTVEDGHEIHAGLEYVFAVAGSPALRVGSWFDPDHAVRYEPTPASDVFDARFSATLPGGENAVHYTAGLGLSFSPRFELNLAGDATSRRTTFSSSLIFRF